MYFCVIEFEIGVNESIFTGNEQQRCNSLKIPTRPTASLRSPKGRAVKRLLGGHQINYAQSYSFSHPMSAFTS